MFDWLFDIESFAPRSMCGAWGPLLPLVNQVANGIIALSYFSIPVTLFLLWWNKRQQLPRPWILLCFALFIMTCGMTHVCDIVAFWAAPYRLFTLVDIICALASAPTALILPSLILYYLGLPSYKDLIEERDIEIAQRQMNIELLRRQRDDIRRQRNMLRAVLVSYDFPEPIRKNLDDILSLMGKETANGAEPR